MPIIRSLTLYRCSQHVAHNLLEQYPSTRTHNLQPYATATTNHNQGYVPHAANICIVSSSWWWA